MIFKPKFCEMMAFKSSIAIYYVHSLHEILAYFQLSCTVEWNTHIDFTNSLFIYKSGHFTDISGLNCRPDQSLLSNGEGRKWTQNFYIRKSCNPRRMWFCDHFLVPAIKPNEILMFIFTSWNIIMTCLANISPPFIAHPHLHSDGRYKSADSVNLHHLFHVSVHISMYVFFWQVVAGRILLLIDLI